MAETIMYYPNLNITAYPTSNSMDEGKINLEQNMAKIVTRITDRNYALTDGSFDITLDPNDPSDPSNVDGRPYTQVISVAPGQANVQGYHIITNTTLRVPPPIEMDPGNHIVIGLHLAREIADNNLLGDHTIAGSGTFYEGVWISYFKYDDPMDPDIFILGYLDWDGTTMSNVVVNPEKYGRLDAKDIICYLSDPKHPQYEFMTLQQLVDNLKDWYVSKLGDDEFGEILWRTRDLHIDDIDGEIEDLNPDNWGISVVAKDPSLSVITVKPSTITDIEHTIVISTDFTKPMIKLGDAEMWTVASDMTVQTIRDLIFNAGRDIIGIAQEHIINKINATNSLTTTLDENNFTFSRGLNPNDINFTIDNTDLIFKLGNALFDYSNKTKYLTISGVQRLMIADPTEFQSDIRSDQTLYFGNVPFVDSWINKDNLKLKTTNGYTINLGNDGNGLSIKSNSTGIEPSMKVENSAGSRVESKTNGNNAEITIKSMGNGTDYLYFNGQTAANNNYFYKLANETAIRVKKDFAADGDITANKVWNAVYN